MAAEILCLNDFRAPMVPTVDIHTAVDVAVRDLREIYELWGTPAARERLSECRILLENALSGS